MFINMIGMSIAIAFAILVYLYINDELSYDQFHSDKDKIYMLKYVSFDKQSNDQGEVTLYKTLAVLPSAMCRAIQFEIPEVDDITVMKQSFGTLKVNDKVFKQKILFADSAFFRMFSFDWKSGSSQYGLRNPEDVILSEQTALKYFGRTDVTNNTIQIHIDGVNETEYNIKGVVAIPSNSSIQFEVLIPVTNYPYYHSESWGARNFQSFIKLRPGATIENFKTKADVLINKNRVDWISRMRSDNSLPKDLVIEELAYTNLKDVHYDKDVTWTSVSDRQYSWILSGIAILIIFIAGINYVSFALASSTSRRKEIGVRKTIGANNRDIFKQFNLESHALAAIAALIGLLMSALSLSLFNEFTGKSISLTRLNLIYGLIFIIVLVLILGLLSGSYPAWYVSRLKPVTALKPPTSVRSGLMRPLVVLQFMLSAFLMISSVIMYRQMHFIASTNLGFDDDRIIAIPTNMGWGRESDLAIERFRQKVKDVVLIDGVTGTVNSFGMGYMGTTFKVNNREFDVSMNRVDNHFISLLDIELIQGRNFEEDSPSDSNAVIVNESLVKSFGWSEPLNELLKPSNNPKDNFKIIGVVKDYHFESLEKEIKPLFLTGSPASGFYLITMLVKLNKLDIPLSLATAEKAWKDLYPDKPFEYTFIDEDVARQYESYSRWMKIMSAATALAIVIACLGLFGLAGIHAVNKTKEIGIRKVMGANSTSIFFMLNKPFVVMSVIAFIIATPVSLYAMNKWMTNFKYHITIGWEIFAISLISGLLVALISVSYHGLKTANVNPAETLKCE